MVTPAGALPPFFTGLLPEGRRLTALRQDVGTSADDEFSLLLAVGTNLIGDVTVVPQGTSPAPASPLIESEGFSFAALRSDLGMVDRVGLPGVQEKASGAMISLPATIGGVDAIVKLDPPECPHAVENEQHFLTLARGLRQPVVASEVNPGRG